MTKKQRILLLLHVTTAIKCVHNNSDNIEEVRQKFGGLDEKVAGNESHKIEEVARNYSDQKFEALRKRLNSFYQKNVCMMRFITPLNSEDISASEKLLAEFTLNKNQLETVLNKNIENSKNYAN